MNQNPRRTSRPRRLPVIEQRGSQLDRMQTGALIIIDKLRLVLFLLDVKHRFLLISLATAIVANSSSQPR